MFSSPCIRKAHLACVDVRKTCLQAGAYVLDFADPLSKLSIKNVQLVQANDDHQNEGDQLARGNSRGGVNSNARKRHSGSACSRTRGWEEPGSDQEENGWSGDESTLLSFGKSDRDSFSLDFRWPLTPMQAFSLALAALDTSI